MTKNDHRSEVYDNPLITRYSSPQMARLWGDQRKFTTWRTLWLWLAEAQAELGLPIQEEQLAELRQNIEPIDFERARAYEREKRHDVMAHVHTFRDACPQAGGIIHWGATSCFVTDNTDLILLRDGLQLLLRRLVLVIDRLASFAASYRDLACLGATHLQPAQPTTVGKRVCLWLADLVMDLQELEHRLHGLRARGAKGTTGTQASFLELFHGDHGKVRQLDQLVSQKMGFAGSYPVTGQTYTRKVDAQVLATLAGVAASCHKAGSDLRLWQSVREIQEPAESQQVGSSAMAYKRNPMRAERMCALARFVINLPADTLQTHATQWMERTLDDSANRRLVLPQAFLATEAVLLLFANVAAGLEVKPKVIARRLAEEAPFLATENVLMAAVRAGGDRQQLHERIRLHSWEAARRVYDEGLANDLLDRLRADPAFEGVPIADHVDVGRAPQQVDEFLTEFVQPIQQRFAEELAEELAQEQGSQQSSQKDLQLRV